MLKQSAVAESISSQLKHRQVKHFGYEFEYGRNIVNPDEPIAPIPQDCGFLQTMFDEYGHKYTYDQLTINRYLPGQGSVLYICLKTFLMIFKLCNLFFLLCKFNQTIFLCVFTPIYICCLNLIWLNH